MSSCKHCLETNGAAARNDSSSPVTWVAVLTQQYWFMRTSAQGEGRQHLTPPPPRAGPWVPGGHSNSSHLRWPGILCADDSSDPGLQLVLLAAAAPQDRLGHQP